MPNTPLGFPYPSDTTDPPLGGSQIQALAESVNTYLTTTNADTGWVTTGAVGVAGSVIRVAQMRKVGHIIEVFLAITLGTAITVRADGDTNNTQVATLPAQFWPSFANGPLQSGYDGTVLSGCVDSAGRVVLLAAVPGASLAVGQGISLTGTYLD